MTRHFYHDLPRLTSFREIFDAEGYRPVPDDWFVACSDVVGSTKAIEAGRYKEVNTAGSLAAMAIGNHFGGMDFPFFFGGDGMICLVPAVDRAVVADLLTGTAVRVKEAFDLELRVGMVPVADLRARGKVLNLAKLEVSPQYCQAILQGDGFDEADRLLKEPGSAYGLSASVGAIEPSFQGYTCRWADFKSARGETLALIVRFRTEDPVWSRGFVDRLEAILGTPAAHHPLRPETSRPALGKRLNTEVAVRTRGSTGWTRWKDRFIVRLQVLYAQFAIVSRIPFHLGKKDLSQMVKDNIASSDYRKFDNTLKMVVSADPASRSRVQNLLEEAWREGRIFYGLHVTDRAMITCLMHTGAGHEVHFVDAADGGYAYAARGLKQQIKDAAGSKH
ncbi:MAG TPA: DUF3095 family protein [Spirochaetia bacterium]|nr:DUF3095 family protein [Spirochaetia bacterium]